MLNALFRLIFAQAGWKLVGHTSHTYTKGVYAVCPHASWVDFFIGLGTRATLRMPIGYLGKEELFRPPFGFIFTWLGGIPVKRNKNMNLVASQVAAVNAADKFLFALAPEGTRGDVQKLRTGFYYMAHQAGIPIFPVAFDYGKKEVRLAPPFLPSGDFKQDMQTYFVPFFDQVQGVRKSWIENYRNGKFDG